MVNIFNKSIKLLLASFIFINIAHAQSIYVGLQGGAQYIRLLNKEDARAKANMDILPTYSPLALVYSKHLGYRGFVTSARDYYHDKKFCLLEIKLITK